MQLQTGDWRKLQAPLIALALALILAAAIGWASQLRKQAALKALQTQQDQLSQARNRYQASGAERETIVRYLPQYQRLIQQGFIGEEHRIEWIDELRTINQHYKLFGISYQIGPQEHYKPPFSLNSGPFQLHRSVMKIESALLHEGDVLTILNAFLAQNPASFLPRDCVLARIGAGNRNKFVPNISAHCEIDWLTLSEPPKPEANP